MIGPVCGGFRCGQRVKINDRAHALYGRYGHIVAIRDCAGYQFQVDLAQGKRPYSAPCAQCQTESEESVASSYRPDLPPIPWRLRHRPVVRGWPLPWFVESDDSRVADGRKMVEAIKFKRCWICGQTLGNYKAFCIGPMCAINRTISEPPAHRECAEWSIRACPFLNQREVRRRTNDLPDDYAEPAGIGLTRQPGASCLWVTKSYRVIRIEPDGDVVGGILFKIGDPVSVAWYREGRAATRAEVLLSIDSGYPILLEAAEQDGPKAVRELAAARVRAMALLPKGDE